MGQIEIEACVIGIGVELEEEELGDTVFSTLDIAAWGRVCRVGFGPGGATGGVGAVGVWVSEED